MPLSSLAAQVPLQGSSYLGRQGRSRLVPYRFCKICPVSLRSFVYNSKIQHRDISPVIPFYFYCKFSRAQRDWRRKLVSEYYRDIASQSQNVGDNLADPFPILETQNPPIGELYLAQKSRLKNFETVKLGMGRSGGRGFP